jgi:hypothetical protein
MNFITCLSIYGSTVLINGSWPLFQFFILHTVGRTPWTGDQPVARPQPTHRTTQTQNIRTKTSMPWVGFEHTIPAFERAKTVHALDRGATATGNEFHYLIQLTFQYGNEVDKHSKMFHFGLTAINLNRYINNLFTIRLTSHNVWRYLPSGFVPVLMRKASLKWVYIGVGKDRMQTVPFYSYMRAGRKLTSK